MGYFEDVYLKRINIDGKNWQERIRTRKEKEFDKLYLKRTPHQAHIYELNARPNDTICSLKPHKWNEDVLISNLMVSTKEPLYSTGDLLRIHSVVDNQQRDDCWLILFTENNLEKGYHLYKVICLDSEVNFTDEYGNTEFIVPVKFVSATSKIVQDVFIHSATQLGYREPDGNRFMITQDADFLTRPRYFNYKDYGYEIAGKDNVSINNVAYITIARRLTEEPEPRSSQDILVGEDTNFFLNGR